MEKLNTLLFVGYFLFTLGISQQNCCSSKGAVFSCRPEMSSCTQLRINVPTEFLLIIRSIKQVIWMWFSLFLMESNNMNRKGVMHSQETPLTQGSFPVTADPLWSSCRLNVFFTGTLRNHYYTRVHCAVLSVWGSLLHREFSKWKECIISKINSVWIAQVRSSRPKFLPAVRPWCSKTNALSKFLLILPLHVICSLHPLLWIFSALRFSSTISSKNGRKNLCKLKKTPNITFLMFNWFSRLFQLGCNF